MEKAKLSRRPVMAEREVGKGEKKIENTNVDVQ